MNISSLIVTLRHVSLTVTTAPYFLTLIMDDHLQRSDQDVFVGNHRYIYFVCKKRTERFKKTVSERDLDVCNETGGS